MTEYEVLDFYMLRVPMLSTKKYEDMFDKSGEHLNKRLHSTYLSDGYLQESLHVASSELYQALERIQVLDDSKPSQRLISSLAKYYIRTSSRPTPFGVFSGITLGRFSDKTCQPILQKDKYVKRARVDMEWVYGVIKTLESDHTLRPKLKVRFNDSVLEKGNRLENPNYSVLQNNENEEKGVSSIRMTEPVQYIRETCVDFKDYEKLIDELSEMYSEVSRERVQLFVKQLLDNEYLLSELRPPLCNTDPLNYLINVLLSYNTSSASCYVNKLVEVKKLLNQYNQKNLGQGNDLYDTIIKKMQNLCECKSYIQVDLRVEANGNTLSIQKKKELEDFAIAMSRLNIEHNQCNEMLDYINEFLERYGFYSEICVTELLDSDRGLGIPKHYRTGTPSLKKSFQEEQLENFLDRKIVEATKHNQKCVEITDSDINNLCANQNSQDKLLDLSKSSSFELYFLVHNGKNDKYSFTLSPAIGSSGVGKTFGRFADMLTKSERDFLENSSKREKALMPEYLFAEIMEIPDKGRLNNITLNNSFHDYQVVLNSNYCNEKTVLSVNDLYIGVDQQSREFYIRSKKYNKRVIVSMTNMLNPNLGSVTLRFLRDISSRKKYDIVSTIMNIAYSKKKYSPRITYKSIIVKPETWLLSESEFEHQLVDDIDFKNAILEYQKRWNIPRYVYLTVNDNRLLLDLTCTLHIKEIANQLKSRGNVKLVENTIDLDNHFSCDEGGETYVSEIVVPFLYNRSIEDKTGLMYKDVGLYTNSNVDYNRICITPFSQVLLPGMENWLYFKLYGASVRQNELLTLLYDELEKMRKDNLINKYFFIRYSDPKPHIRVRIKANDNCLEKLFEYTSKVFIELRKCGLISSVTIDSYQRETERYGGPDLIQEAEEYFYQESQFILKLITAKRFSNVNIDDDLLVLSFLSGALEVFGVSLEEKVQFMDTYRIDEEFRKHFQQNRKKIMRAVDTSNNWKSAKDDNDFIIVLDWLNELLTELAKFANKIEKVDEMGRLANTQNGIIVSIIHMFCNRLFANTARERKNYFLARHGLYALYQQKKHYF